MSLFLSETPPTFNLRYVKDVFSYWLAKFPSEPLEKVGSIRPAFTAGVS
ncbi:hypothetical protein AB7M37_006232 [Sinorhizobium fredii]